MSLLQLINVRSRLTWIVRRAAAALRPTKHYCQGEFLGSERVFLRRPSRSWMQKDGAVLVATVRMEIVPLRLDPQGAHLIHQILLNLSLRTATRWWLWWPISSFQQPSPETQDVGLLLKEIGIKFQALAYSSEISKLRYIILLLIWERISLRTTSEGLDSSLKML